MGTLRTARYIRLTGLASGWSRTSSVMSVFPDRYTSAAMPPSSSGTRSAPSAGASDEIAAGTM